MSSPRNSVSADADEGLNWTLAGGAVVLFGGLGLLALRRRRPEPEIMLTEQYVPVERTPVAPAITETPAFVATAPSYKRSHLDAGSSTHGPLEAIAAAAPSAENPFLTRKNRLRRAHFLLRQQEAPAHAAAPAQAPVAMQAQRSSSPVYDFGGGINKRRGFRPATT